MHLSLRTIIALAVAAVAFTASAEGDATAGKTKFETCRGCHAVPGYTNAFPQYHVPKIAGQHAARIVTPHRERAVLPRTPRTMHGFGSDIANLTAAFLDLRHRRISRWFRLAGHTPLPAPVDFDDTPPAGLATR